jgi:hypothetical protein
VGISVTIIVGNSDGRPDEGTNVGNLLDGLDVGNLVRGLLDVGFVVVGVGALDGCPPSSSPEVSSGVGLDVVGFDDDDDDPGAKKGTMGMNVVGRSEEETDGAGTATVGTDVGLDVGLR